MLFVSLSLVKNSMDRVSVICKLAMKWWSNADVDQLTVLLNIVIKGFLFTMWKKEGKITLLKRNF